MKLGLCRHLIFFTGVLLGLSQVQAAPIRLATMNLHCQFEDWRWRMARVGEWLAQEKPAVVFFQEVCDGNGQSMTAELPALLRQAGYPVKNAHAVFAHDAWDGKYREHLMVLSLWDSVDWIEGVLPSFGMRRVYLGARHQGSTYVDIHLTADPPKKKHDGRRRRDEKPRESRTAQIEFLLKELNPRGQSPIVLMGDFNSTPGEPEQAPFQVGKYHSFFPGPTEPLPDPQYAIDGSWMSSSFFEQYKNISVRRALDSPVQGRWLSDHSAVLVELSGSKRIK